MKDYVAKRNTFKMANVEVLLNEAIENRLITISEWENYVRLTENLQDEDFLKEVTRDGVLEPVG